MKFNVPETVPAAPAQCSRIPSNTTQIFIGLLLGIAIGYMFPSSDANGVHTAGIGEQIKPIADTFLRMIKMIIAPLLFSTLVVGIAGTGDLKSMGRIGLKAIIYFEVATTIALFLGLLIVNVFQPGVGVQAPGAWVSRGAGASWPGSTSTSTSEADPALASAGASSDASCDKPLKHTSSPLKAVSPSAR